MDHLGLEHARSPAFVLTNVSRARRVEIYQDLVSVKRGVHKGSYDPWFPPCHIGCMSHDLVISTCKGSVR